MNTAQHGQSDDVHNSLIQKGMKVFLEEIKHGPTYACTVCHKGSFPNQVRSCIREKFTKNPDVVATYFTGTYVHECDDKCIEAQQCQAPIERRKEWICFTCQNYLKAGAMPPRAVANKLKLAPIPAELCGLNTLAQHVISLVIVFSKIIALAKGGQRSIHGNVVCVPSEVEQTVNSLPRPDDESQLLRVKLKRRMCYKGHYQFQTLDMKKVITALQKLKEISPVYRNISIREDAFSNLDSTTAPMDTDDDVNEAPENVIQQNMI